MTLSTLRPDDGVFPSSDAPDGDAQADASDAAAEIVLAAIVALVAPLLMDATKDAAHARLAAIEIFGAYKAQTQAEWLNIAQAIGFGLAAVDTLRLAMADDVPLSMKLRLRACANALNRSSQRSLRGQQAPPGKPQRLDADKPAADEAWVASTVACVPRQERAAQPAASADPVAAPVADPSMNTGSAAYRAREIGFVSDATRPLPPQSRRAGPAGQPTRLMWASAMNKVAVDLMADSASPAGSRMSKSDLMWANTLASVARDMLDGAGSPLNRSP